MVARLQQAKMDWGGSVICWPRRETWLPTVSDWLNQVLGKDPVEAINWASIDALYADDVLRITALARTAGANQRALINHLARDLDPAKIVGFHACRPEDVSSYYQHGIMLHDRAALHAKALEIAATCPNSASVVSQIKEQSSRVPGCYEGQVYLALDHRMLTGEAVRSATHYAERGSEYISGLFGRHRDQLRTLGVSTVFEAAVPIAILSPGFVDGLARRMLSEWTRLANEPEKRPLEIDVSIILHEPVKPDWLVACRQQTIDDRGYQLVPAPSERILSSAGTS